MSEKLYMKIYRELKGKLASGEYKKGDKLPTECELVEQYGVSRVTAIRAMKLLEEEGAIERIPRIGSIACDCVGQDDTVNPENIQSGTGKSLLVVLPISTEDVPMLLSSIQRAAAERGYIIIMMDSHRDTLLEREILRDALNMDISGVICYPLDDGYRNLAHFANIKKAGIPIVTVDKRVGYPALDIPFVTTDNRAAMRHLTEWLIAQGHSRIACCCASLGQYNERERFYGCLEALTENNIDFDPELFCELFAMQDFSYEMTDEIIVAAVDRFLNRLIKLPEPPTALMCICDVMAFTVRQRALALGINVPERLSLTGFDNLRLSGMLDVPLTTMAQNFAEMGRRAVEIIDSINSGRKYESTCYLEAELIVRKSVVDLKRSAG